MSKSFNHNDLVKLFGKPGSSTSSRTSSSAVKVLPVEESKENKQDSTCNVVDRDGYRRSNQSLVVRNNMLKLEIATAQRKVGDLQDENERLRRKIQVLENGVDNEKVELLVAERFQKKLAQFNSISERTVQYLAKSADDFRSLFGDMSANIPSVPILCPDAPKQAVRPNSLSTAGQPTLDKVEESPLVSSSAVRRRGATAPPVVSSPDIDATPKVAPPSPSTVKRRSVLRRRAGSDRDLNLSVQDVTRDGASVGDLPLSTPVQRRPRVLREPATTETPAPAETDTVRRKRAAATKIRSLAEPSLGAKLRRPGKYDEPSPFVSHF